MIPLQDQELIRERFAEEVKGPVKIDLFMRRPSPVIVPGQEECPLCPEVEQIVTEVSRLSSRIELRVHQRGKERPLEERYGIDRIPATVIRGAVNRPVVFYGMPALNLFPLLIDVIGWASMEPPALLPAIKRRLKRLKKTVRLQVLVTPNAPYCADQAGMAVAFSLSHPHIRSEIIEITEFPSLAERYNATVVPFTVIDEKSGLPGLIEPEKLAEEIVRVAEHQAIAPRTSLILGVTPETATRLPSSPRESTPTGQVRPSGLIIPGR